MSAPQFTPGPWLEYRSTDPKRGWFIDTYPGNESDNGYVIADNIVGRNATANARLIATAPEQHAALEALVEEALDWQAALGEGDRPSLDEAIAKAQAAIAKVRGGQ